VSSYWNALSEGGGSGRATDVIVDPSNANIVYLGTAGGGLWKSIDAGATWVPLTDTQASLAVGAIALDPNNPRTLYVGTGESNSSLDSYYGAGLLKSTNGGASWKRIAGPFAYQSFGALAVSPADGSLVLAGTYYGLYRSADGGITWASVLPGGTGYSILFDPGNPAVVYAALGEIFGSAANGVYKSTDAGQTWTRVKGTGTNVLPASNVGRLRLVMDQSNPATLYLSVAPAIGYTDPLGIYRTVDAGRNWVALTPPSSDECCDWYGSVLAVSPTNPGVLFVGAGSMAQSADGGMTWNFAGGYGLPPGGGANLHPDQHAIAFSADGATMYVATDGGVYKTSNPAGPNFNWQSLNATISTITFYNGLAIDPTDVQRALGGTQDNGTNRYSGSLTWTSNAWCGDGGYSAFDFTNPQIDYSACGANQGIAKTLDGGVNYAAAEAGIITSDRQAWVPPLVMDPSNAQVLYWGTYRVYQTTDGAASWVPVSGDLAGGSGTVTTVAVAPTDSNTVYVGASDGSVQISSNAGSASGAIWTNVTGTLPQRSIAQIAVDPRDAASAVVVNSGFDAGHVFQTSDRGSTWVDISGNLPNSPVNTLVIDPGMLNTIYVGTDVGVFQTTNNGQSWIPLGQGLPNVVVNSLALHSASRTLRAATHGRSAWDISLPTSSFAVSPIRVNFGKQFLKLASAPVLVTVTNNDLSTRLTISSITVLGDYQKSTDCGAALAPGAKCSINLTFTPLSAGARAGSLTVAIAGDSQLVSLTGTGVVPPVPTATLTASPQKITTGHGTTLTWSSANATACAGSGGASGDGWAASRTLRGTKTVLLATAGTYTYTITCTVATLSASANARVTVTSPPPASGGGGGSFNLLSLLTLLGGALTSAFKQQKKD
jgi:photosystem II stability/assembly factor-like uncharacterized protein